MEPTSQALGLAQRTAALINWRPKAAAGTARAAIKSGSKLLVPASVHAEAEGYAFTEHLLGLIKICIVVAGGIGVALMLAVFAGIRKPTVRIDAPPTLRSLADNYFKAEGFRFDQIATSIVTILTLKHHVDDGGAPYFALIQGMVAPKIYAEAESGLKLAMNQIRQTMAVQNLNITGISDFETDKKTHRISCYVRGYFVVSSRQTGRTSVIPYRAEVLLEQNIVGNLDPLPYAMMGCTEKIGAAAIAWDRERESAKGKTNGN